MTFDHEARMAAIFGAAPRGRGSLGLLGKVDAATRGGVDAHAYLAACRRVHERGVVSGIRASRDLEVAVESAVYMREGGGF
ncbi:MAG: hypothetical protein BGO49_00570 [Planctomycetales bacterium 71-10]|nr:MAG: hypothetical protein BGO49_00570 [Planctomycetales bacterium 71-10]